jgi:hypothetical protein
MDIFKNVQNENIEKVFYFGIPVFLDSLINAVKTKIKIFVCDDKYFSQKTIWGFFCSIDIEQFRTNVGNKIPI